MSFAVDIAAMVPAMPNALFPEAVSSRFHGGIGLLYSAVAIGLSGLARTLWLAVLLAPAGAADLVSAVYRQALLQTYAPDEMRGRMQGVFTVVVTGGPRLGDLRAGAMAGATTLTLAWSGSAVLCAVLVVAGAPAVRSFWRYDAQRSAPPATEGES